MSSDVPSSAELTEARERFAQGRKLEEAGQFGEALVAFQNVARVKKTPQVQFHIALCLMHTGHSVEALAGFRTAVKDAGATAPTLVAEANDHIAQLEKQIAVVTLEVLPNDSTLAITFDDRVVTSGVPFNADPGNHQVILRRSGQTIDERVISVSAGEQLRMDLAPRIDTTPRFDEVPHVEPLPHVEVPSAVELPVKIQPTRPIKTVHPTSTTNGRYIGSIVAFSAAGASVVGLSVFAFLRADRLAELEAACPSFTGCNPSLEPIVRDGKMYASVVNVFAGLAGAATVTGIVLYVVSRPSTSPHSSALSDIQVRPMVGLGSGFVAVHGRF
jgi:hypothetical protein